MQTSQKQARFADSIVAELDQEAEATKRLFAVIPEDKLDWRPHPKAKSLGELAMHIAMTQGQVAQMTLSDSCEVSIPPDVTVTSVAEIDAAFAESLATAKSIVADTDDVRAFADFTVSVNGNVIMTLPRAGFWRMVMLNHYYHHRGQLSTYIRQLDIVLPSVYGPTADTNPFA